MGVREVSCATLGTQPWPVWKGFDHATGVIRCDRVSVWIKVFGVPINAGSGSMMWSGGCREGSTRKGTGGDAGAAQVLVVPSWAVVDHP